MKKKIFSSKCKLAESKGRKTIFGSYGREKRKVSGRTSLWKMEIFRSGKRGYFIRLYIK